MVNLRGTREGKDWYTSQRRLLEARGLALHDLRLSTRLPSRQEFRRLVETIDSAERPLLLHCLNGSDRTGLAAAIALLLEGANLETAHEEFSLRHGHLSALGASDLPDLLEQYRSWLAEGSQPHSPERLRRFAREGYTPYFYDAGIEPAEIPARIETGTPYTFRFRVTNRSPEPWRFTERTLPGVHLDLHLVALDQGISFEHWLRGTTPNRSFAPGESIELPALLPPFPRPGRYRLTVDLVDEFVAVFGDMGSQVLQLDLKVLAREPDLPAT